MGTNSSSSNGRGSNNWGSTSTTSSKVVSTGSRHISWDNSSIGVGNKLGVEVQRTSITITSSITTNGRGSNASSSNGRGSNNWGSTSTTSSKVAGTSSSHSRLISRD